MYAEKSLKQRRKINAQKIVHTFFSLPAVCKEDSAVVQGSWEADSYYTCLGNETIRRVKLQCPYEDDAIHIFNRTALYHQAQCTPTGGE